MKKIVVLLGFSLLVTPALAVQLYEAFDYPSASSLASQGGWVLTAGTSPTIQAGSLTTPGLMPASGGNSLVFGGGPMEVRHELANALGGEQAGAYWYSLAFKVTDIGAMNTTGGFVAGFSQSALTNASGGRLHLRKDILGTANGYNIGVSKTSGLLGDVEWAADVFLVGQTNFVVCKYATPDQGNADTLLWINPDPSTYGQAAAPVPTLTATAGTDLLAGVGQFLLHQSSATEGPGVIVFDQIRVEGGWPHVTPVPLTNTIAIVNETDLFLAWGGNQNVLLQQTASLTPPVAWENLNGGLFGDASIRNYTIVNVATNPSPKFYRLHAWYPN